MGDPLSTTLAALADPTRRAILARLALGETAVTELAEPFAMSLPAVSKHLKVLERAGLIARGREAQWRPCRLQATPLKDVAEWIEGYRRFWEQSLDRLEDYLQELQANEAKVAKERKRGRRKSSRSNTTSKPESKPE
jgi:DNA-binding transcriptional ArsR family regulator